MAKFNPKECTIPKVWCGNGKIPKEGYSKKGTPLECMRMGFGAGMYKTKVEYILPSSLQNIKYIGDVHELSFSNKGYTTISKLVSGMRKLDTVKMKRTLEEILTMKNGVVDIKAYNSVLLFLHNQGVGNLPRCRKIK